MKHFKWIALAVLVVVVTAAVVGYWSYGRGKEAGITEGLATRDRFFLERMANPAGAALAGGATGQAGAAAAQAGGVRNAVGAGAAGGNLVAGQVKSISGNDLEISTANDVTKVRLTDKTQIQKTVAGAPGDIKTGERVVVQGSKGADGTVEASSIQVGAGRFGGLGAGQGQGSQ